MKIKNVLSFGVLFLLSIQINFTSCSDEKERTITSPVNDPLNNYQVVVEIISVGGFIGCSSAAVLQLENPVPDAEVMVNNVLFTKDTVTFDGSIYTDEMFQLSYFPNTKYDLNISHQGTQIATGSGKMPSTPEIRNISGIYNHDLNKNLEVKWKSVNNASSIELIVSSTVFDEIDSLSVAFSSGLLPPSVNNFTVPGAFFNTPGEYMLGIAAYNGINPGVNIGDITSTDGYLKGYNLTGAAGIFLITNLSSDEGTKIVVGGGNLIKEGKIAKSPNSFLEVILNRHKRNFKDKPY